MTIKIKHIDAREIKDIDWKILEYEEQEQEQKQQK